MFTAGWKNKLEVLMETKSKFVLICVSTTALYRWSQRFFRVGVFLENNYKSCWWLILRPPDPNFVSWCGWNWIKCSGSLLSLALTLPTNTSWRRPCAASVNDGGRLLNGMIYGASWWITETLSLSPETNILSQTWKQFIFILTSTLFIWPASLSSVHSYRERYIKIFCRWTCG